MYLVSYHTLYVINNGKLHGVCKNMTIDDLINSAKNIALAYSHTWVTTDHVMLALSNEKAYRKDFDYLFKNIECNFDSVFGALKNTLKATTCYTTQGQTLECTSAVVDFVNAINKQVAIRQVSSDAEVTVLVVLSELMYQVNESY